MTMGPGYGLAAGGPGGMRAADADRERAAEVLRTGFAEGRLDKDEYDSLLGQVYAAKTYAELAMLTSQLPGGGSELFGSPAGDDTGQDLTNSLAVASLVCGIVQFFIPLPIAILAIVLGHVARRQIARNGGKGGGLALAGLVLGWAQVVLGILFLVVFIGPHG